MQLLTSKRVVLAIALAVMLVGTMGLVSADTNATTVDEDNEMTPGESSTDAMSGDMIGWMNDHMDDDHFEWMNDHMDDDHFEWMNDHMDDDHFEWMNDHMESGQAPCH